MAKKSEQEDYKYLVIVESPAKSKTLTKILGPDYLVKSSIGHIRDLPAKGLGIDLKKNFEPQYEIMSGKEKVVSELNQYAKKAEKIYLASDPDREGEAIAWHLQNILNCKKSNIERITFNQITPNAVKAAVEQPRSIDQSLVNSQQARRILDRLVGYKISPILWRKIGGRSAGRVQSIAVRLICEREEEIRNFKPEEFWTISASALDKSISEEHDNFFINLTHIDSKRISTPSKENDSSKVLIIKSKEEVEKILQRIFQSKLKVSNISIKNSSKNPKAPFKTSTLQRAASNALGFTVKRTMQVAQSLYEGVKLGSGSDDQVGLITYMRTDSLRLAPESLEAAKDFILNKWGNDYYPGSPTEYDKSKKPKKNEQDAHEAIRPTYVQKTPDSIKSFLNDDQYKLYKLIWNRFVSSQMSSMKLETKSVEISSESKDLIFKASQSRTTFPGYSIVYGKLEVSEDDEDVELFSKFPKSIAEGDQIQITEANPDQHFTEGPPRYNEASLVKTLEELGIGRPSTYAPTIATIQDRKYVEKNQSNALVPTKLGISVNKLLVDHFGRFINTEFTSQMEARLDEVAEEKLKWQSMLEDFYFGENRKKTDEKEENEYGFIDIVKKASSEIENVVIETEFDCPTCGAKMNLKSSRYGPFLGCSDYPNCKTVVNLTKEGTPAPADRAYTEESCPECKNSSLVIRYGRYGDYIACTTPDCNYSSPILKKTGITCPRDGCGGDIVEKKSRFGKIFYGCSNWSKTGCDVVFWYPPIDEKCPECSSQLMYKSLKRGDKISCSNTKNCTYNRLASLADIEKYKPMIDSVSGSENKSVFSL